MSHETIMTDSTRTVTAAHVALLAPVPLEHLVDGCTTAKREGRVAFGSRAWQVFRELDQLRKGLPVDVYIYASHTGEYPAPQISWRGRYIGHVESIGGAHPDGMRYRPSSTAKYLNDNSGHWAVFWEVEELEPVPVHQCIPLVEFTGFDKEKPYGH